MQDSSGAYSGDLAVSDVPRGSQLLEQRQQALLFVAVFNGQQQGLLDGFMMEERHCQLVKAVAAFCHILTGQVLLQASFLVFVVLFWV